MVNGIERRKHHRTKARWPIAVLAGEGKIEGGKRDIAIEGILICCEKPLPLNEIFSMSIIPPNHQAVDVIGKVVWSDLYGIDEQNTAFAVELCFAKISDRDRHFLKDMVSVHPK